MKKDNLTTKFVNLLILLPIIWTFSGLFYFHNGDKILVILTIISAVSSFVRYGVKTLIDNINNKYTWLIYGMLCIAIVSEVLNLYNPINIRAIAIIAVLLTFYPYQIISRNVLVFVSFIGGLNSFLFVYKFTYIEQTARYYWPINAIPFATYICFISVISFMLLITRKSKKETIILILNFLILIISLSLTETRGAFVALIPTLSIIYFYISYKNKNLRKSLLISALVIITSSLLIYPIIKDRIIATQQEITQIDNGNTNTSIGLRLNFWKAGIFLIKQSPFTGYGDNYFNQLDYLAKEKIITIESAKYRPPHFHNQFIDISVKCGILGLISFIIIIFSPIFIIKNKSSDNALTIYSLILVLILSGLTDVPFFHKQIFIIYFLCIGIFIGKDRLGKINKGL